MNSTYYFGLIMDRKSGWRPWLILDSNCTIFSTH